MTADQKSGLLKAFQTKQALAGAGVILVEGASVETLREPKAVTPRIAVILQRLDQSRGYWVERAMTNEFSLQIPKVGIPLSGSSYVCLIHGTHAVFVGAVAPAGAGAANALTQAARALESLSQELKPDGMSLQEKMQRENQVFTSVSNILKTKHDTVKNSISNVR
jgi:hypothetical protein